MSEIILKNWVLKNGNDFAFWNV